MKVLALNGSPRKGGNTDVLLAAVIQGVEKGGNEVEVVRLNKLTFRGCQNCGGCDETGVCILEDDLAPLYDKVLTIKKFIIASPIYFYGVTAQAKAFIDRMQALWNRKRLLKEKGEWQADPERKGFFVSVGATKGDKLFDGAVLTVKYAYDAMDVHYAEDVLVRGIDKKGEMEQAINLLREAERLGQEFVASTQV